MRRDPFVNEHFYHVYNRGTDKRIIFQDGADYLRFIHDLYELNDLQAVLNIKYRYNYGGETSIIRERELLVDIVAWCLMPNHYHLLLRQRIDNGISMFMQKLGTAYTMYFNKRYERSGVLFQGVFKSRLVNTDPYLTHLVRYVHLNPVSLIEPEWERIGIKDWSRAVEFLSKYRWSSHLDYINTKNFPSIINKDLLPVYPELNSHYLPFLYNQLKQNLILR